MVGSHEEDDYGVRVQAVLGSPEIVPERLRQMMHVLQRELWTSLSTLSASAGIGESREVRRELYVEYANGRTTRTPYPCANVV